MKVLIAGILVVSVASIVGFAALSMGHEGFGHETGCIAASLSGIDCPQELNLVSFAAFHIGALKGFSSIVHESGIGAVLLLVFLFVGIAVGMHALSIFASLRLRFLSRRSVDSFHTVQEQKLIHWLAFHQNSPAVV